MTHYLPAPPPFAVTRVFKVVWKLLFLTSCWGYWVDFGEIVISMELVFVSEEGLNFSLHCVIQGSLRRTGFDDSFHLCEEGKR